MYFRLNDGVQESRAATIKSIRAASDVIVIAINAALTPAAALAAFDTGVWP